MILPNKIWGHGWEEHLSPAIIFSLTSCNVKRLFFSWSLCQKHFWVIPPALMQEYEITHHCYVLGNRVEHFSEGGSRGRCGVKVDQADLPVCSVEQIFWWSFIAERFSILPALHLNNHVWNRAKLPNEHWRLPKEKNIKYRLLQPWLLKWLSLLRLRKVFVFKHVIEKTRLG